MVDTPRFLQILHGMVLDALATDSTGNPYPSENGNRTHQTD